MYMDIRHLTNKEPGNMNKNKRIIYLIIVLIIFIGVYFLMPIIKKYIDKNIGDQTTSQNLSNDEWLKSQVKPMTDEEKVEVGKNLIEQSKKLPKLTPKQQKEINDFLNH